MNKTLQTARYIVLDFISALAAWSLFFVYRKSIDFANVSDLIKNAYNDTNYYLGIAVIPVFWIFTYFLSGYYRKIYRKSRLKELFQTLSISLLGATILFFLVMLDDRINGYQNYYRYFLVYFSLHFIFTYILRLILTSWTANLIHKRKIGFNTIIVGNNGNAIKIYNEINRQKITSGNIFVGYVVVFDDAVDKLSGIIPRLGTGGNIRSIINENKIEEVIIAIEPSEHKTIAALLAEIENEDVDIKIIADERDILSRQVKTNSIFHTPLIDVPSELMPIWQRFFKRVIDVIGSVIIIMITSPLLIFTAIMVKLSSKGPVIYSQERVGLHGKPFVMHKFRSMYQDAEAKGPALSSDNDPRITPWGKVMRKYRLDELPQFYNVLLGNMSLVGPRPERQFFINQIVERAPYYKILHKVKPGITSWGQVKYGYAENIDEMIERMYFDLLYIDNISILTDLKILIYTVLIVIQGRGK